MMKLLFTFLALFFTTVGFSQDGKRVLVTKDILEMKKHNNIMRHGPNFVQDLEVKECWAAPEWPENELIQPTVVNELPNGTMPLSKDLPFVHTIRGTVYTYEHLKYQVR